ncbi:PepSY-associated TM helix domain-containing protein [Fulvivirgaceae bacterium BMA10]|uniref:PepSY-associated TM helix domain-containing protein n=1 Tax=Splendidivirga corallicola TaxID=3051826 RepID=A0ABT8L146_9BACT|nr:PepSY-associated TM helix domain-containing protein [Fulvivirgaceae bacterium BMA10]
MGRNKFLSKSTLFKVHGWVGIKLSILFFIVCFSGTLAVFSHEMDWLFNPNMRAIPTEKLASRNLVVKNLKEVFPDGQLRYWERSREPYLTDILHVYKNGKRTFVFVNQYTGDIQGMAGLTIQRFFRDLHYYLFIPNQVGHFIVLFFGFVLLISLITGVLYYKDWYKKLFLLHIGKGSRAFYSSLHKLVGAWSVPFMALIAITGIWYFIERTDFPEISAYMDNERPTVKKQGIDFEKHIEHLNYDTCITIAQNAIPDLQVKSILVPSRPTQSIYLTGQSNVPLVRDRANRVFIDPYTYNVLKAQKAKEISTATWLNDIADPLHFGYWGGLLTKSIWFIFGLGLSSLILTGPWLYLKRRMNLSRSIKKRKLIHG